MKLWKRIAVAAGLVAWAALVHVDIFPDMATYGVSVGSNLRYCSVELVHWQLGAGCEAAR